MTTTFSVIIPSYNHAPYVETAVRSVLDQTFDDLELVVVDDGSSDDSLQILRELARHDARMTVHQHEGGVNRGLRSTVARGMAESRGTFVTILASDDQWLPSLLGEQVEPLRDGAVLVYGQTEVLDGASEDVAAVWGAPLDLGPSQLESLLLVNTVPALTATTPRTVYERVGGLTEQRYEDLALWLRCVTIGPAVFLPSVLARYRRLDTGLDSTTIAGGRDLHAFAHAVRSLAEWPELPAGDRPTVASWDRCWTAVTELVDRARADWLAVCHEKDRDRLVLLLASRQERLRALLGDDLDEAWAAGRHRAAPGLRRALPRRFPGTVPTRLETLIERAGKARRRAIAKVGSHFG